MENNKKTRDFVIIEREENMQKISFTKMSGSGNDFIVIDNRKKIVKNPSAFAKKYCDRKFGVGADGILLVENSKIADFRMVYYNSDGSRASFCGNGARCISLFAYTNNIAPQKMSFESDAGLITSEIKNDISCHCERSASWRRAWQSCYVKIKMPNPKDIKQNIEIKVDNRKLDVSFANTGVPHVIVYVKEIKNIDVDNLGKKIRWHRQFQPQGTNVNFVKILGKNKIQVRTYERGVEGETLACGTGVVASSVISITKGLALSPVNALTQGGEILKVYHDCCNTFFEGKVNITFEGKI